MMSAPVYPYFICYNSAIVGFDKIFTVIAELHL